MAGRLDDKDWSTILHRIRKGKCTPFLGAGASSEVLPTGGQIAAEWAEQYGYPLDDKTNLIRVSQFVAVEHNDAMRPKDLILERMRATNLPDFMRRDQIHGVLADLPLPIYLTTNYDNFMWHALHSRNRKPHRELCRWNRYVKDHPSVFEQDPLFEATVDHPIVFHLHGIDEIPESLVLTEDDYFDFLVNISRNDGLLPPRIERALTGSSLLFLGYGLTDWNFRVLFRSLVSYLERALIRAHVSVQIGPGSDGLSQEQSERMERYLTSYYAQLNIRVYWGTCQDFATELRQRWEDFRNAP